MSTRKASIVVLALVALAAAAGIISGVFDTLPTAGAVSITWLPPLPVTIALGVMLVFGISALIFLLSAAPGQIKAPPSDTTDTATEEQERAKVSSMHLQYLSKYTNDFIMLLDKDFRFLEVNDRMTDFYGYSREELNDLHAFDLRAPEAKEDFDRQIALAAGSGSALYETVHKRKDGMVFPVEINLRAIDAQEKRLYLAVVRDISERKGTETALHESERKYRELVEDANSIILRWTNEGRISFLNEFGQRFFGYSAEEIIGRHVMGTIVPTTDSEGRQLRPLMDEICANPVAFEQNVNENMRRNGERVWVSWTNRIFQDAQGHVCEILSVGSDVTELKRAEEALFQSEELYRTLAESTLMGVWHFMPDGRTVYANPAMRSLLELESEHDFTGRTFQSFFAPESIEAIEREQNRHLQGIRSTYEAELVGLRGRRRSVVISGASLLLAQEKQLSLIGTFMDITGRKLAETELHRLKDYLKNIIDSMPSVLVGLDSEGKVVQWSTRAQAASGVDSAAAVGQPAADILAEFAPWIETLQKKLKEEQPAALEKVLIPKNGERRFYDLMLYPLTTGSGEGAVLRIEDTTERARIQELMVQTEKMMSLGGLAAGMAHEINNPLGIITQAAQNIERRVSPDLPANNEIAERVGAGISAIHRYFEERQISQFIRDIREATLRAARIVENVLQFSRKSNLARQNARLSELLDRAVELAESDYDLKKNYDFRSIEIIREYDPDLPEVPVVAVEIEQVILNLLKNSGQALAGNPPERKPRIILRTKRDAPYAIIEVEDNGPGMEENVRLRVFEPFFTTKGPGVGTGLGLSVSYTIITINHNGFISVDSAPERGARFTIRLPVVTEG